MTRIRSEQYFFIEYCVRVLLNLKTPWIEIVLGCFVSLELRESDLFQMYIRDGVSGASFSVYLLLYDDSREFMCNLCKIL